MSKSITESFTLNNAWKNLYTQALADGYTGSAIVKEATVMNFNATVAYLHVTSDGGANPATPGDGMPLSNSTAAAPSSTFTLPPGTDIAGVWIHTAGNLTLNYVVIGA